jgi:acetyl-CoA C-acetyltransferase
MSNHNVVIVSARRTPIGAFQGALAAVTAPQLGTAAAKAAIESAGIQAADVQETIFGCVLPAGLGQAPARQAALGAGIPNSVPATTINKMCGSGLKAVMLAADQIRAGDVEIVLAGGLESMTNAPYLLPTGCRARSMGNSWAPSLKPPRASTVSRANSRMLSPPSPFVARCMRSRPEISRARSRPSP